MTQPFADDLPVIVGVGEITDRPADDEAGLEPLHLILRAAQQANQDAGGGWLSRIDRLDVVPQLTWPYKDLSGLVADNLGIAPERPVHEEVSGDSPVRLLMSAAQAIAERKATVALVCGGEAMESLRRAGKRGATPAGWTRPIRPPGPPDSSQYVSALAADYGLSDPTETYTLYENAARAAWGQTADEAQRESAVLFEQYADVARHNEYAWDTAHYAAADIAAVSPSNRPISYPYTKRMVAQMFVNQGAAVILTRLSIARAAGVNDDDIIFVWSGCRGSDNEDFLVRARMDQSPPMDTVLRETLKANGIRARELDAVELYSCFPIVPKLACRTLGELRSGVRPTVAGGLPFFGGPLGNYMSHAITAMVRKLRQGDAKLGLLYGNGGYLTKHAAAVLSTRPPQHQPRQLQLQDRIDSESAVSPQLLATYSGAAIVETFVVRHDLGGDVSGATVVARTPEGHRTLAQVNRDDVDTLLALVNGVKEPIGLPGRIDGLRPQTWHFDSLPQVRLGGPGSSVLLNIIDEHIAVVTLNRPTRRNAVNALLARTLRAIVAATEADPAVRAVVLTSSDPQVFCAGLDLQAALAGQAQEIALSDGGFAGFVNAKRTKPWIAAVRGQALGGGFELALACDMIVAGDSAVFGLPDIKRGLLAAAGGVARLPRLMPRNLAVAAVLTGQPVTAAVAQRYGLLNALVADEVVTSHAIDLARLIAANAPLAVTESLCLLHASPDQTDEEMSRLSLAAARRLLISQDAEEGARAFLEKRPARWGGR
jgi:acetyl-CoA C-acetyltransferase